MTKRDDELELDDEGNPVEAESKETPADTGAADFTESVKEIAKSFTDTLKEMRETKPAEEAKPDLTGVRERVQTETNAMMEKYQELAAAGEYAKAAQFLMTEQSRIQESLRGLTKPEDDPGYKAVFKGVQRTAKKENADIFEKYGSEVEAEIARFAPTDRLDPDTWDEAIKRVKASHIDEIIQAQIEAGNRTEAEAAAKSGGRPAQRVAPQAKGRQVVRPGEARVELDAEQQDAARILGMSDEEYAKNVADAEKHVIKSRFGTYLSLAGEGKPKPGQF